MHAFLASTHHIDTWSRDYLDQFGVALIVFKTFWLRADQLRAKFSNKTFWLLPTADQLQYACTHLNLTLTYTVTHAEISTKYTTGLYISANCASLCAPKFLPHTVSRTNCASATRVRRSFLKDLSLIINQSHEFHIFLFLLSGADLSVCADNCHHTIMPLWTSY